MPVFDPGNDPTIFPNNLFGALVPAGQAFADAYLRAQQNKLGFQQGERDEKRITQEGQRIKLEEQREQRAKEQEDFERKVAVASLPNEVAKLAFPERPDRALTPAEGLQTASMQHYGALSAATRAGIGKEYESLVSLYVNEKTRQPMRVQDLVIDADGTPRVPQGFAPTTQYDAALREATQTFGGDARKAAAFLQGKATIGTMDDLATIRVKLASAKELEARILRYGAEAQGAGINPADIIAAIRLKDDSRQIAANIGSEYAEIAAPNVTGGVKGLFTSSFGSVPALRDVPSLIREASDLALSSRFAEADFGGNSALAEQIARDSFLKVFGSKLRDGSAWSTKFGEARIADDNAGAARLENGQRIPGPKELEVETAFQRELAKLDLFSDTTSGVKLYRRADAKSGQQTKVPVKGGLSALVTAVQEHAHSTSTGDFAWSMTATRNPQALALMQQRHPDLLNRVTGRGEVSPTQAPVPGTTPQRTEVQVNVTDPYSAPIESLDDEIMRLMNELGIDRVE